MYHALVKKALKLQRQGKFKEAKRVAKILGWMS